MAQVKQLRALIREMEDGAAAALRASDLPHFGADECAPFYAASEAIAESVALVERLISRIEARA